MQENFIKIGHRGACGYEPENTLVSFNKALELGVDAIEFDVYTLKDGVTVVFHDDTLERTTNGAGALMDQAFEDIRKLDAGKGEHIPTIHEALTCINRKAQVNIELKGLRTANPVARAIQDLIDEHGWEYEDFLVSSLNIQELYDFKVLNDKVRLGYVLSDREDHEDIARDLNLYFVAPGKEFVSPRFVERSHAQGIKVFVWTVNEIDEISMIKSMGVDGIFSDYPDRL